MATRSATKIPQGETEFLAWSTQMVNRVGGNPDLYFFDALRVDKLKTELTEFRDSMTAATAAKDAALAATRHKNTVRAEFEANVRTAMKMIQANDQITDADREAAGVQPHKTTRTPVAVPTTNPIGFVMTTDRLEHTLTFSDSATPTRKAKPHGVTGCEVYLFIGNETPQSPSRYNFHMLSTRSPQRITFSDDDAGKMANYLLRWVNTKGQSGPWSQIASATIPAV